jgi:putative ATP-binding cassette transporter
MQSTTKTPEPNPISWRKFGKLIKPYFFNSDEKLKAWLLLIGTILCVVGLVALTAAISWWAAGFWAIIAAKTLGPFLVCMGEFALLLSGYVGVFSLKNYLIGKLSIQWRNWLTNDLINKLFGSEHNYLELKRHSPKMDNIAQRIQEDVSIFVDSTLNLGADLLNSTLSLGTFIGTLWIVGGALAFVLLGLNIVIPGYLVWVALIIAVAVTVTSHFIAKSLPAVNQQVERTEADLRQELAQLDDSAENIAVEHAEDYYKSKIDDKVLDLKSNTSQRLDTQTKLVGFQNFYTQLAVVLPALLAAPLYFSGLIEIGQLMQIGMAFGQVSTSLNWFANTYESLATYKASFARILELEQHFEQDDEAGKVKQITRKVRDKDTLKVKNLDILKLKESGTEPIMRKLTLKLVPGEHTVIKGRSGLGKSTLFKVISGVWDYGFGKVSIPAGKVLYFLPQKPTLPHDTLKAVLAYPESVDKYKDEEYAQALKAVGQMDEFIARLAEKRSWKEGLSGGQQQRIAFARVLLKKPDWLFLDEATSSLDEEGEEQVYRAVQQLKNTTVVSIAHRSTVDKFHSRVVFFKANQEREVEVLEQMGSQESFSLS